ncbi:MAG: hypothetical protein ACRDQZ_03545 [Mycobacteriales bacterium]
MHRDLVVRFSDLPWPQGRDVRPAGCGGAAGLPPTTPPAMAVDRTGSAAQPIPAPVLGPGLGCHPSDDETRTSGLSMWTTKVTGGPGDGRHGKDSRMKHTKSKARRGLVTRRIVYASHQGPHARHHELKVDVRRGTVIDMEYAAALVAVRTPLPLADITIVKIEEGYNDHNRGTGTGTERAHP